MLASAHRNRHGAAKWYPFPSAGAGGSLDYTVSMDSDVPRPLAFLLALCRSVQDVSVGSASKQETGALGRHFYTSQRHHGRLRLASWAAAQSASVDRAAYHVHLRCFDNLSHLVCCCSVIGPVVGPSCSQTLCRHAPLEHVTARVDAICWSLPLCVQLLVSVQEWYLLPKDICKR